MSKMFLEKRSFYCYSLFTKTNTQKGDGFFYDCFQRY